VLSVRLLTILLAQQYSSSCVLASQNVQMLMRHTPDRNCW
jgi:hypothetical protein